MNVNCIAFLISLSTAKNILFCFSPHYFFSLSHQQHLHKKGGKKKKKNNKQTCQWPFTSTMYPSRKTRRGGGSFNYVQVSIETKPIIKRFGPIPNWNVVTSKQCRTQENSLITSGFVRLLVHLVMISCIFFKKCPPTVMCF